MNPFRPLFFISVSLFLLAGCVGTNHLTSAPDLRATATPLLNPQTFKTALYKATIDAGSRHFSGLFYFKTFSDSSVRIVFLSEFGLNLLDLEYKNHSFLLKTSKKFMNKKMIVNTLKNNLRLLIDTPQGYKQKVFGTKDGTLGLIKFKGVFKKYYYFYQENEVIDNIIQLKTFSRIEVNPDYSGSAVPSTISIHNKPIHLTILLTLIKTT